MNGVRVALIPVVLLLCSCERGFGRDARTTIFPTAVFSPDGTSVYYVQFDVHGNWRYGRMGSDFTVNAKMRVIDETISIHRLDLADGKSELVTTLPRPPWVGLQLEGWYYDREARMWWSPEGKLEYEIHGPPVTLEKKRTVWYTKTPTFISSNPVWADLSYEIYQHDHHVTRLHDSHKTELEYVVSGSKELVTSFLYGEESTHYIVLLDHDLGTARLLVMGFRKDRKLPADFFTYRSMLGFSRLKRGWQ